MAPPLVKRLANHMKTKESLTSEGAWPSPENPEPALALIRRFGIWNLGGWDGCPCTGFQICSFHVEVECRRSRTDGIIRVYSASLGRDPYDLEKIAREVSSQVEEVSSDKLPVRYCSSLADNTENFQNGICCYCGLPRHDFDAYLCTDCKTNHDATKNFPWGILLRSVERMGY